MSFSIPSIPSEIPSGTTVVTKDNVHYLFKVDLKVYGTLKLGPGVKIVVLS